MPDLVKESLFTGFNEPDRIVLTYGDILKRLDPDDKVARVIELLHIKMPMLQDMPIREGNLLTGHRSTIRTDLPKVSWRKYNEGVIISKSKTQQFDEPCGTMETWSEVDEEILKINGNNEAVLYSENLAFIEALEQEAQAMLMYGNKYTDPDKIYGVAPRYDIIETDGAGVPLENNRVVSFGDENVADPYHTSIYLIRWGENTVHGIFPKGVKAGLDINVKGFETLQDGNKRMVVHRTQYIWKLGLAVRDWRYIVRLGNINPMRTWDEDALKKLARELANAYEMIPDYEGGTMVFYCNRAMRKVINWAAMERKNGFYMIDDIFGKPVASFWGIPIKRNDQIVNKESVIRKIIA